MLEKSAQIDWNDQRKHLQFSRFKPLYDKAFAKLQNSAKPCPLIDIEELKKIYLEEFDRWVHGAKCSQLQGLETFPGRDFISGVTHALDDLHIVYGPRLVVLEKEYAYHRRIRPNIPQRRLETLQSGDVLVLSAPFPWFGDLHPQTNLVLDRCRDLKIPVHIDASWFGCVQNFKFDVSHPAIHSVSMSLSKGLGLGLHRAGVRYARERHPGPVTVINDFQMQVASVMWLGIQFMQEFGSDYLVNKYRAAYEHTCEKMNLRPTKAIHMAFAQNAEGEWLPAGIRPFLRYLADGMDEFS